MATTTTRGTRGPRVRGSAPAGARADRGDRDQQYDLLTAALLGAALGAGATLLLRRPPKRRLIAALPGMAQGARAVRGAMKDGRRAAGRARDAGGDLLEQVGDFPVRKAVARMLRSARAHIDETVADEVADLRKALRRRRRRLGL